jgi:hypothetical protein
MATLTGDVRVWSLREDVVVRDADFSAVRYRCILDQIFSVIDNDIDTI